MDDSSTIRHMDKKLNQMSLDCIFTPKIDELSENLRQQVTDVANNALIFEDLLEERMSMTDGRALAYLTAFLQEAAVLYRIKSEYDDLVRLRREFEALQLT